MYGTVLALSLASAAVVPGQFPPDPPIQVEVGPLLVPGQAPPRPDVAAKPAPARDVVLRWNDAALNAIKADRTPPPVAARNLAVLHVAVYEAVNAIHRTHQSFRLRTVAPANTSPEAAAAVAAHRVLISLYPKQVARFDAELDASLEPVAEGVGKVQGVQLGLTVAERVLAWRAGDLANRQSAYTPRTDLGSWQPTPPANFRAGLLPGWTAVRGFAIGNLSAFRPAGPPDLTSEEFAAAFRRVKELGSTDSPTRSKDQTEIARFWMDGEGTVTPPGHWNRIARDVAVARRTTLAENARLFAMLNVVLADAAIACWDCKFAFGFWRPVTAIRAADRLNNPALAADPDWTPLLPTPPFPAYSSGHSTFSGAAAAVLAAFFGTDEVRFTTTSDGLPGVTRSFAGFRAAAEEAGLSRIYGGIHWDFDNRDGLAGGRAIGELVSRSYFQPKAAAP